MLQTVVSLEKDQVKLNEEQAAITVKLIAATEGRKRAEEAAARSDAERSRLQHARDDAASTLRARNLLDEVFRLTFARIATSTPSTNAPSSFD